MGLSVFNITSSVYTRYDAIVDSSKYLAVGLPQSTNKKNPSRLALDLGKKFEFHLHSIGLRTVELNFVRMHKCFIAVAYVYRRQRALLWQGILSSKACSDCDP